MSDEEEYDSSYEMSKEKVMDLLKAYLPSELTSQFDQIIKWCDEITEDLISSSVDIDDDFDGQVFFHEKGKKIINLMYHPPVQSIFHSPSDWHGRLDITDAILDYIYASYHDAFDDDSTDDKVEADDLIES